MKSQTRMVLMAVGLAVVSVLVYLLTIPAKPAAAPRVQMLELKPMAATRISASPRGPQLVMQRHAEPTVPEQPPQDVEQPAQTGSRAITVRVIDENDAPVVGLSAAIHWSRPSEMDSNPYGQTPFSTGEDGGSSVNVPDGASKGRFFVQSKGWRQADYAWFQASTSADVVLRVYSTRTLRLNITYADGRPYEGKVLYAGCGAIDGMAKDGVLELAGVPARDGMISVFVQRPGYDPVHREITAAEILGDRELTLTVPQSARPTGLLRVKANRPPDAKDPLVELRCQVWSVNQARAVNGCQFGFIDNSAVKDVPQLAPGEYVVRTASSGYVSRKVVVVVAGEITEVDLTWEAAASVRAELVMADGTPIQGAVLRLAQGGYARFPASPSPGTQAVAGADGIACLSGLPVGACELAAEAPGFELATVKAELAGAGAMNLGRITLEKATTNVVVEVQNADPSKAYTVQLGHPNGAGSVGTAKLNREGRVVFTEVPAREYLVLVSTESAAPQYGAGARMYTSVARKEFTLTKSDPAQLVFTLDVATPKSGS